MTQPKLTVIISYYKALDKKKIILKALNNQSVQDFEVIISKDDNNELTTDFYNQNQSNYNFSLLHIHQKEDNGFQKNKVLNRSILAANSDLLAFIDGDCVPHRHFVKAYVDNMKTGFYYPGRAVFLSAETSEKLVKNQDLKQLEFANLLFAKTEKLRDGIYSPKLRLSYKFRGIVGRNWGIPKQHLLDINGFDEDYILAGVGEDIDIEWRLRANGLDKKSVKNKAIVYHIFHPKNYSEADVQKNLVVFEAKKKLGNIRCLNGIERL